MTRLPWRLLAAALVLLTSAAVLALFVANQSGGEDGSAKKPTPTAVGGGPDLQGSPFSGGTIIEAASYYVTRVGLNGKRYMMTAPISCDAFAEPEDAKRLKPEGKVCIDYHSASFKENSGVISVSVFGVDRSWELTFDLAENGWRVTDATATTPGG